MKINKEIIRQLALLNRLRLTPEEEKSMVEDLENILEMMDKLKEVDTTNVEAFSHFEYPVDSFRDDVAEHNKMKKHLMQNAPQSDKDFFIVPKVIERNE